MDNKRRYARKSRGSIGVFGAIAIGIGGMVGGGIFAVLGEAVALAHGATPAAFLVGGLVALLTSYSYAKLSVAYQTRGGTVKFIDHAFGNNLLSGTINLMLWLSYLVTIALYAVAFAAYALTFFPHYAGGVWRHAFICLAIVLPALINLISATFVSESEVFIVLFKLALLVLIIATSAAYVHVDALSPRHWDSLASIAVAGMVIFVAYEGFELIANAAEDIDNPRVNLPRAFYGSVLVVILLYVLIAAITVGAVPENLLAQAQDYALAVAAKPALGAVGFTIVAIAALLATFSAINATIYGNARLGYILAKDGQIPQILDVERRSIPTGGVVLTMFLSLMLANAIDLTAIAIIASAGFLLIFFLVNVSAYKLRGDIGARAGIVVPACVVSAAALITLLMYTFTHDATALSVFVFFILVSILFELFYGKLVRKHIFRRPYD